MNRPARIDVCADYRVLRHIGLTPVKAANTLVEAYGNRIAEAVDRAAGSTIHVDPARPLMARYRIACEWQQQAQQLTQRRITRYDPVDAWTEDAGHASTVWVPIVGRTSA